MALLLLLLLLLILLLLLLCTTSSGDGEALVVAVRSEILSLRAATIPGSRAACSAPRVVDAPEWSAHPKP